MACCWMVVLGLSIETANDFVNYVEFSQFVCCTVEKTFAIKLGR